MLIVMTPICNSDQQPGGQAGKRPIIRKAFRPPALCAQPMGHRTATLMHPFFENPGAPFVASGLRAFQSDSWIGWTTSAGFGLQTVGYHRIRSSNDDDVGGANRGLP
jgi:hypothetical protein